MRYRSLPSLTAAILLVGGAAWAQPQELGTVNFPTSCNERPQAHFQTGVAQLHHMMYEQARPHFEAAAKADASCAMAHWGIAMTSFQPLWHPTSDENLARGKAAVERARTLGAPTAREAGYIAATDAFFTDPDPPARDRPSDHEARVNAWEDAQRQLHEAHRDDVDAAAFYALAQVAYAMTQFSPHDEHDYARHVHRKVEGLTPEAVAGAHKKDLEVQDKHGVKYLQYWYNQEEGRVFCLVEAPHKEAATSVHREAHGLMADEITEVTEGR